MNLKSQNLLINETGGSRFYKLVCHITMSLSLPPSIHSVKCNEYRGLTHRYKTSMYGEDCLLFINSSQESYLSDVGLNPTRVLAAT